MTPPNSASRPGPRKNERLIVALDTPSLTEVKKLLRELKGINSFYKIGSELFTAHGWKAVELVKKSGARVFLDLKFHDIPNTVAKTAAVVCEHNVDMFNVHASGGLEMMRAAREAVDRSSTGKKEKPVVLAVTVLTSLAQRNLSKELGVRRRLEGHVLELARLAKHAGLDGVVSSAHEIRLLRRHMPKNFVIVTPGIRPAGSDRGDQKRVFGSREALAAGANFLVVGRPITAAAHPRQAVLEILSN